MSKARQKALEKFPILFGERTGYDKTSLQQERRNAFEKGYHQAEKDLELTIEDIKTIDKLLNQCVDYSNPYQEVLKRFKNFKERKEK